MRSIPQSQPDNTADGSMAKFHLSRREVIHLFGLSLIMRHGALATSKQAPVALARPKLNGALPVEKALLGRRSVRDYAAGALTLTEV